MSAELDVLSLIRVVLAPLCGTFGSSLAASFGCWLAGTLARRAGSCLAGGAGRVLAWRVNGTTGQALRNSDPAERQLPSAQPGSWCALPHRPCNRNRTLCFLAVSDRQSAGCVGPCAFMAMACRRSSRRRSRSSAVEVRARPGGDVPAIPPPAVSSRPETKDPGSQRTGCVRPPVSTVMYFDGNTDAEIHVNAH
jgi:hypothetical protein